MGILSEHEKELLMRVPTTVEQAELILKRNQGLLTMLDNEETGKTEIGCPHCDCCYCRGCAWQVLAQEYGVRSYICCHATFGGISHGTVKGVDYSADVEELTSDAYEDDDAESSACTFLEGHMEWAMLVIAKGGVDWPDKIGDPEVEREDD
jgi:hypothetical protein